MRLFLASHAKTIPSNYNVIPVVLMQEGSPGFSCTDDTWAKALRQESEFYDWEGYMACVMPKVEHPEYVRRSEEAALFQTWDDLMKKLEPLPRLP